MEYLKQAVANNTEKSQQLHEDTIAMLAKIAEQETYE